MCIPKTALKIFELLIAILLTKFSFCVMDKNDEFHFFSAFVKC